MARRPHIIVPAEVRSRELDAKLFFACVAAEHGFTAITGCHAHLNRRIYSLPRSIYIGKSLTKKSLKIKSIASELGHIVVAWDEEGLVYMKPEFYHRHKLDRDSVRTVERLFAWGEQNAQTWRDWQDYEGTPIHVTGNPRADLMRPEVRAVFASRVEELKGRYGRYIMISSNFGRVNHFVREITAHFRETEAPERGQVPVEIRGTKRDPALAAARLRMMNCFLDVLPKIAKAFPEHRVILRPHPSEDPGLWEEAAKGCGNVVVINEDNAMPWLMAAEAVVHNGCTTGLEASLLDRPAISYRPFVDPDYEIELPNQVSHVATDEEELVSLLKAATQGQLGVKEEARQIFPRHFAAMQGALASDRIMEVLDEYYSRLPARDNAAWLKGQLKARWRHFQKLRNSFDEAHHNSARYISHRFPDISLREIDERIDTFREVTGRFGKVGTRQIGTNSFEVFPRR